MVKITKIISHYYFCNISFTLIAFVVTEVGIIDLFGKKIIKRNIFVEVNMNWKFITIEF